MTRTARLEVVPCKGSTKASQPHFVRLVASNGEALCHSQVLSTRSNAKRSARAWLRAMSQIREVTA